MKIIENMAVATNSTHFIESAPVEDTTSAPLSNFIYTSTLKKPLDSNAKDFSVSGRLRDHIESMYHVKLGRYVRHIDGKVYLFFPNKTGLTGNGWAKRDWKSSVLIGSKETNLLWIKCGTDCELVPIAYRYRYKAMGLSQVTEELFESQSSNCLYAWYNNHLYRVGVANIDGTMYMEEVPNQAACTC